MKTTQDYAVERNRAFCAFVEDGDFSHIDELLDSWGLERIPHTDTGKAAVYKAVQECVGIPAEVKAIAFEKCIGIGFEPYAGWRQR